MLLNEEAEIQLSKKDELKTFAYKEVDFREISANWMELVSSQRYTEVTRESQTNILKNHLLPIFGDIKLKDIEPLHIQKFLYTKRGLSAETQRKIIYLMRNILNSAVKWNRLNL